MTLTEANNVLPIKIVINYKPYVDYTYDGALNQISISEGTYFYLKGDEGKLAYILANILVNVRPTKKSSPIAEYLVTEVFDFEPWVQEEMIDTALAIDYLVRAGFPKELGLTNELLDAYNPTYAGLRKIIFVKNYLKLLS